MYIIGKIIGALFGGLIAGPVGSIVGIAAGHFFDRGLSENIRRASLNVGVAQKVFFSTTFEMIGYIAKADGRVSEQEIQAARNAMAHLQLSAVQKKQAIDYFNLGKSYQFNWEATVENFIKNCGHDPHLVQLFVEIQIQAAFVDGLRSPYKRNALERLCLKLNIPRIILAQMEARYYAEQSFRGSQQQQRYRQYSPPPPPRPPQDELADAYGMLGVKASDTTQQIKKAYRQLMSQHHPDKLVAKGLPEGMIKIATEKTQGIQKAYELICKARGLK
jgi:DnaJ like chaperone protein